jgi:uncharacterized protein (DUF1330 family)
MLSLGWTRVFGSAELMGVTAFVVVEILEVVDDKAYADYRARVDTTVAEAGGAYLARSNAIAVLEGTWRPQRFVIVEFPTTEAARNWWAGEPYRELKALRQRATRGNMILVEGNRRAPR